MRNSRVPPTLRAHLLLPSVIATALVTASCGGGGSGSGSVAGTGAQAGPLAVSFVASAAEAANGTIPHGTAAGTCGSPKYGWISELAHVGITQAKVTRHWAPFVKSANGIGAKDMEASGTVSGISVGGTDVPFDHPFGADMSFDEKVDAPYAALHQNLGTNGGGNPPGVVHDELMTGLVPHPAGTADLTAGMSWPAFAAASAKNPIQSFVPLSGDRIAAMGSWVVDCGHTDFHSELHSLTFLAFGHHVGDATVAHAYYNPYEVAQVFNPDPSLSGMVTEPSVLTSSSSQNFLNYIVTAIVRVATGQDAQAQLPVMLEANRVSPSPWTVCAPAGTHGGRLGVSYRFSVRPGVTVSESTDAATGCATFTTTLTASYRPVDAPGERMCPTTWDWLDKNAFSEASTFGGTGNAPHSIPEIILQQVAKIAPQWVPVLRKHINQPLLSVCFPVLSAPDLGAPAMGSTTVTTAAAQVMPFVGWVKVAWEG